MATKLSTSTIEQIRTEVLTGKSKYQVAKERNLPKGTIYRITKDLPSKPCGWSGIRGKTLALLQELLAKGFVIYSDKNSKQRSLMLRTYFPSIRKTKMYGKTILFLEGKEENATRAFLASIKKKIISYQELKQITNVFDTELSSQEKHLFLGKYTAKKSQQNQRSNGDSLHEEDIPWRFFTFGSTVQPLCHSLRIYCL